MPSLTPLVGPTAARPGPVRMRWSGGGAAGFLPGLRPVGLRSAGVRRHGPTKTRGGPPARATMKAGWRTFSMTAASRPPRPVGVVVRPLTETDEEVGYPTWTSQPVPCETAHGFGSRGGMAGSTQRCNTAVLAEAGSVEDVGGRLVDQDKPWPAEVPAFGVPQEPVGASFDGRCHGEWGVTAGVHELVNGGANADGARRCRLKE